MAAMREKAFALEGLVAEKLSALRQRMDEALGAGRLAELLGLSEELLRLHDARRTLLDALRALAAESEPKSGEIHAYKVGTRFLRQCYLYLMNGGSNRGGNPRPLPFGRASEPESIHAVTGIREGRTVILTETIPLEASKQSPVRAEVGAAALSAALRDLQESGHVLWAIFHSHRAKGPSEPSGPDLQLQRKLETGGYRVIQAVFSEDGHMRFFPAERSFQIEVYGKGVEQLGDKLFRITGV